MNVYSETKTFASLSLLPQVIRFTAHA